MPPEGPRLSVTDVGLLRAWIEQGAVWPDEAAGKVADKLDWWSLKPLVQPPVPITGVAAAPMNPIDAFVEQTLREKAFPQAPEADRRTLIRRLYFDLIGLPPTPEEIAAFVGDHDPAAYEHLVDHLLASPRYGERWARHWMDAAHFAETHGHDQDRIREYAWPYRDYSDRVVQCRQALRPLCRGASGRRRAVSRRSAGHRRPRIPGGRSVGRKLAARHSRKHARPPDRPLYRSRRHGFERDEQLRQRDGAMRPLPRSQVRPDFAARLLRAAGRLRRRRQSDPSLRCRRRGRPQAARIGAAKADFGSRRRRVNSRVIVAGDSSGSGRLGARSAVSSRPLDRADARTCRVGGRFDTDDATGRLCVVERNPTRSRHLHDHRGGAVGASDGDPFRSVGRRSVSASRSGPAGQRQSASFGDPGICRRYSRKAIADFHGRRRFQSRRLGHRAGHRWRRCDRVGHLSASRTNAHGRVRIASTNS